MTMCSIQTCERKAIKKGFCNAHYLRNWRHGDPERGGIMRGSARDWLLAHVNHEGDDCLTWPFARNAKGYPDIRFANMEGMLAHRVMCVLAHGEPIFADMDAAHSCGNGQRGCVNPKHLSWKTRIDNHADKRRHGTQIWGDQVHMHKLTREQAHRAKYSKERGVDLAREFNVRPTTIYAIRQGRTLERIVT